MLERPVCVVSGASAALDTEPNAATERVIETVRHRRNLLVMVLFLAPFSVLTADWVAIAERLEVGVLTRVVLAAHIDRANQLDLLVARQPGQLGVVGARTTGDVGISERFTQWP